MDIALKCPTFLGIPPKLTVGPIIVLRQKLKRKELVKLSSRCNLSPGRLSCSLMLHHKRFFYHFSNTHTPIECVFISICSSHRLSWLAPLFDLYVKREIKPSEFMHTFCFCRRRDSNLDRLRSYTLLHCLSAPPLELKQFSTSISRA